jgi:proton glutamate symport protein
VLSDLILRSPQGADTIISASASERGRSSVPEGLTEIVPRNIFASLNAGSVIQAVLFSIIVGLAIGLLRDRQRDYLHGILQSALAAFLQLNRWLIYLLPLGAVLLIAPRVAAADTTLLPVISRMLLTLGATLAGLSLIFGFVLWRRGGKSLGRTISALVEPLTYAFITGNSLSAIPYSLRAMEDRLGFSSERAQATLPVIAAVLRCGSAVTFVIAAAFVASFYGLSWSTAECATLLVAAALGSLVSAGAGGTAAIAGLGLAFAPLGLPDAPVTVMFAVAGLLVYPLLAAFEAHVALAASSLLCREPVVARARQRAPRLFSIRVTILSLITVLVVLTGAVCIGVMYSGQRKNIAYLADAMIDEISARVVSCVVRS